MKRGLILVAALAALCAAALPALAEQHDFTSCDNASQSEWANRIVQYGNGDEGRR